MDGGAMLHWAAAQPQARDLDGTRNKTHSMIVAAFVAAWASVVHAEHEAFWPRVLKLFCTT